MSEKEIKEILIKERLEQGIRPYHIFKATGVTPLQLKRWEENSDKSINLTTFMKLVKFYGYDIKIEKVEA